MHIHFLSMQRGVTHTCIILAGCTFSFGTIRASPFALLEHSLPYIFSMVFHPNVPPPYSKYLVPPSLEENKAFIILFNCIIIKMQCIHYFCYWYIHTWWLGQIAQNIFLVGSNGFWELLIFVDYLIWNNITHGDLWGDSSISTQPSCLIISSSNDSVASWK